LAGRTLSVLGARPKLQVTVAVAVRSGAGTPSTVRRAAPRRERPDGRTSRPMPCPEGQGVGTAPVPARAAADLPDGELVGRAAGGR
jgi:hypothetical protein